MKRSKSKDVAMMQLLLLAFILPVDRKEYLDLLKVNKNIVAIFLWLIYF